MAFRPLLQRRGVLPTVATACAAGTLLIPRTTLHAESPPEQHFIRKPIYDDLPLLHQPTKPTSQPTTSPSSSPTPTDRLAAQIQQIRIFVHAHTILAENQINALMSSFLAQERSFTQTIASLAPPRESHERLMPGALYVLVAAMAGSIVSRNRNILLRASVPFAVGLGAAWVVLPLTMRNVGDLMWVYEEKVPVLAENHLRIRGAVGEGWRQAEERVEKTRRWSDEVVGEGREAVEGWIKKGK